jgi:hypothetical protein
MDDPQLGESKKQIWDRLLRTRKDKELKMEKIKAMKDELQFQAECSFKPQISTNSRILTSLREFSKSRKSNNFVEDIPEKHEDRLYQEAFERKEKKERMKMLKDRQEIETLTFKPNLEKTQGNPSISIRPLDERPIQERYKEIQDMKSRMIQRLRDKFDEERNFTYKPKISKISEKVAEMKNQGVPVVERLIMGGEEIQRKRMEMLFEVNQEKARECTFQPEVNYEGNLEV